MEADVHAAIDEWKLQAQLERIRDPLEIAGAGIITIPALAIDGEIVFTGYRGAQRIRAALRERMPFEWSSHE